MSALGNVHTLDLRNCQGLTDVSALGNVNTLKLRGNLNLKTRVIKLY